MERLCTKEEKNAFAMDTNFNILLEVDLEMKVETFSNKAARIAVVKELARLW